jgi:Arc/MetJ-type ribon-helix-helix transcriptional regulator
MKKRPAKAQEELWTESTELPAENRIEFSEEEWQQPASDNKGHSVKLSCRVPPPVARMIEAIVASQRFPYQTADDLVRHAVVRHLYALHSWDQTLPRTLYTTAAAIIRMVQDHEAMLTMREAVVRAAGMLQELAQEQDWAEVARRIAFVDAALAQMPATSPWRRKFESMWRKKTDKYRQAVEDSGVEDRPAGPCPSTLPAHIDI